jgi:hypothetical protein
MVVTSPVVFSRVSRTLAISGATGTGASAGGGPHALGGSPWRGPVRGCGPVLQGQFAVLGKGNARGQNSQRHDETPNADLHALLLVASWNMKRARGNRYFPTGGRSVRKAA